MDESVQVILNSIRNLFKRDGWTLCVETVTGGYKIDKSSKTLTVTPQPTRILISFLAGLLAILQQPGTSWGNLADVAWQVFEALTSEDLLTLLDRFASLGVKVIDVPGKHYHAGLTLKEHVQLICREAVVFHGSQSSAAEALSVTRNTIHDYFLPACLVGAGR